MDIDFTLSELDEAAEYEHTEIGEVWSLLVKLHEYENYLSEKFTRMLEREIESQYKDFKKYYELEENTTTVTRTTKTLRRKT